MRRTTRVAFIGLYYLKFILEANHGSKASAVYWDKINRIVPFSMIGHTGDSPTVKLFKDELEFIDSISSRGFFVVCV
jgi:hypothetical protein